MSATATKDLGRALALEEIASIVERYSSSTFQRDRLSITATAEVVERLFGSDVQRALTADGGWGTAEVRIEARVMSLSLNKHHRVAYDDHVEVRYAGGIHLVCVPPSELEADEVELYVQLRAPVVAGDFAVSAADAEMAARTALVDGAGS